MARVAWLRWSVGLTFALATLLAAPIYYLATITQTRPAIVPQATLTNGDKVVVFQGMQHVGIERFDKSVVYDLEDALSKGYVAYYEGVRGSTPEADGWFNGLVAGGGDLTESYTMLGKRCGLQFQGGYFDLIGRDKREHPASHAVADVSTLDTKREYDRLMAADTASARAMRARPSRTSTGGRGHRTDSLLPGEGHRGPTPARRHPVPRPHDPVDGPPGRGSLRRAPSTASSSTTATANWRAA